MEKYVRRNHKDSLFRFIFGNPNEKQFTLDLYNAINNTNYTNTDDLQLITLENSLYVTVRNDVSILINDTMNFLEHQSTINQNMPFRCLEYYVESVKEYCISNNLKMNRSAVQKIPAPHFFVLYNGVRKAPAISEMKLSDMFISEAKGDLEAAVRMININFGENNELMKRCRPLYEYAWFEDRVRKRSRGVQGDQKEILTRAVMDTIAEMSDDFVLKRLLGANAEEVANMFITNATEESIREDGYEEGKAEGLAQGLEEGKAEGLAVGRAEGLEEGINSSIIKVFSRFIARGMDKDEAVHETAELLEVTEEYVSNVLMEQNKESEM
ncbi:MAG: hypothetical protein E7190_12045 [Erysipelotrichaceae bacterium]|nr:hypothetical protein [Erysipelotrichaceae bacterium]